MLHKINWWRTAWHQWASWVSDGSWTVAGCSSMVQSSRITTKQQAADHELRWNLKLMVDGCYRATKELGNLYGDQEGLKHVALCWIFKLPLSFCQMPRLRHWMLGFFKSIGICGSLLLQGTPPGTMPRLHGGSAKNSVRRAPLRFVGYMLSLHGS